MHKKGQQALSHKSPRRIVIRLYQVQPLSTVPPRRLHITAQMAQLPHYSISGLRTYLFSTWPLIYSPMGSTGVELA